MSALPVLIATSAPPCRAWRGGRPAVEILVEAADRLPHLTAAGEAAPARADQPDERVAVVDRDEEVLPGAARAIDQQRLDVRHERVQHGVARLELLPRLEGQQRLRRAHRTRVEGADAVRRGVVEEERHVDGQPQLLPQQVVEREAVEPQPALRHQPVVPGAGRLAVEQQRARPAGAAQLAVAQVEQVPVLGRDRRTAEVAVLELGVGRRGGRSRLGGQPLEPRSGERSRHQTAGQGPGATRISICSSPDGAGASSSSMRSTSGAALSTAASMADFSVSAEDGQPLQLPCSRTRATPSSTPSSSTSPPWDSRYGRTSSSAPRTRSRTGTGCSPCRSSRCETSSSPATARAIAPSASWAASTSVSRASPWPLRSSSSRASSSASGSP